jgi:hypothetical protein
VESLNHELDASILVVIARYLSSDSENQRFVVGVEAVLLVAPLTGEAMTPVLGSNIEIALGNLVQVLVGLAKMMKSLIQAAVLLKQRESQI